MVRTRPGVVRDRTHCAFSLRQLTFGNSPDGRDHRQYRGERPDQSGDRRPRGQLQDDRDLNQKHLGSAAGDE